MATKITVEEEIKKVAQHLCEFDDDFIPDYVKNGTNGFHNTKTVYDQRQQYFEDVIGDLIERVRQSPGRE